MRQQLIELESPMEIEREFIAALAPTAPAAEPVAGVARVDEGAPLYWVLSIRRSALSMPRLMDCLALLALDQKYNLLPRVLLPYSPPSAEFTVDGRILYLEGKELSRTSYSLIRTERVYLRTKGKAYVEWLYSRLRAGAEDAGFVRPEPSHRFADPVMPTWKVRFPPFYSSCFE